jgi:uncharacterized Zn finger protein (UPF0148 family)
MNPKAAQRLNNGTRQGDYTCQKCQAQFHYDIGLLECPTCHTTIADNLIATYTEVDPQADEMLSRDDFGQGD